MERIHRARSIEELIPELESLYRVAERKLAQQAPKNPAMLNRIAGYLAEVRSLLDEVAGAVDQLGREAVRSMAGRYRDLEGRVKEYRNDLTFGCGRRAKGG
jgi:hypothetical protein